MGNAKAEREELKKLEDEAYNELCQIIAEAMQFQDITLLDQRIANWKKKYKKLLDSSSSASANFKKRIEYLLNEYYSKITQYILKQVKKGEQKRIENQSKALRKLHYIIKETDDFSLLKKKVKEWENKYPISGFITMYQKRIKIYTSEKYLKENAFDQDMAFRDLYYITKLSRTYDEFKEELSKWEDKYSIHDKFELDDFIKHQSDVNRYTSDEYLKSIAYADNSDNQEIVLLGEKIPDSSPEKQASAYASLISVARKPNNIDEIFDWVYKYNSIKFNDEYKDLILRAIYLDYSPTYISSLSVPKINLSSSLSFEEYENIDEIKRYTVISYFNLLLPPDRRIPNNYFSEHIEKIYRKSRTAHFSNEYNEVDIVLEESNVSTNSYNEIEQISELEIDISSGQIISKKAIEENIGMITEEPPTVKPECKKTVSEKSKKEPLDDIHSIDKVPEIIIPTNDFEPKKEFASELSTSIKTLEPDSLTSDKPIKETKIKKTVVIKTEPEFVVPEITVEPQPENLSVTEKTSKIKDSKITEKSTSKSEETLSSHLENKSKKEFNVSTSVESKESQSENGIVTSDIVVGISPFFFEIMNNKVNMQKQQQTIVTMIDTHVENYMSMTIDKTNDISKTRIDSN